MQEVPFYALFVEAYSLLFVLPISYVMYLFMSESVLRPVLQDPLFAGLPAAGRRIRETSFLTRLLITIASVTITPVAIFGFMLVSLVLGLVDTQTGLLYYVNAEHPWSILYRGNAASFIENELSLRKLGMSADGRITVRVFEMQPGDVLICGSDGRDDILLHTPDGRPKMNEDEDLILSAVVSAKGELPQVYEICAQRGEITDDYSLLKIAYFGDTMPETEKTAMRSASGAYYRAQNYLKAIAEGEKYLNSRPADTQFMRFLSRCHRLAGNYEIAIDLAERLRLRQPDDTRNLTNLAAMHILRGDASRAQQLVAEIRALDAQYPALRKLDELLQRRARRAR